MPFEETWPRLVHHGEGFEAAHEDAIGDNQTHINRKFYADIIHKGFENLANDGNQGRNHHQLNDDSDARRDGIAYQGDDNVRESRNDGNGKSITIAGFSCEVTANAEQMPST